MKNLTIEECLYAVKELNKDINQSEDLIRHKANWLYMLNKLNFWNDIPVLLELMLYEANKMALEQNENNKKNISEEDFFKALNEASEWQNYATDFQKKRIGFEDAKRQVIASIFDKYFNGSR